jgi:hypothetical protein
MIAGPIHITEMYLLHVRKEMAKSHVREKQKQKKRMNK